MILQKIKVYLQENKIINQEIINYQLFSGLSNTTYKIEFADSSKSLVYKSYKNLFPMFVDHQVQIQIIRKLNQLRKYPQLIYFDQKGRVQQFVEAIPLQGNQIKPEILIKIIQQLAFFSTNCVSQITIKRDFDYLIIQCNKIKQQIIQKHHSKLQPSKIYIQKLLNQQIINNVKKVLPHEMILSHNDANLTNFLINNKNQIILLDYEFACFNYIGFDIGNLLNEIATEYSEIFEIHQEWELEDNLKKQLIKIYFNKIKKFTNEQQCMKLVNIGRLLSHYFWFFIGLASFQDESCTLNLNYYMKRRFQEFMKYLKILS